MNFIIVGSKPESLCVIWTSLVCEIWFSSLSIHLSIIGCAGYHMHNKIRHCQTGVYWTDIDSCLRLNCVLFLSCSCLFASHSVLFRMIPVHILLILNVIFLNHSPWYNIALKYFIAATLWLFQATENSLIISVYTHWFIFGFHEQSQCNMIEALCL